MSAKKAKQQKPGKAEKPESPFAKLKELKLAKPDKLSAIIKPKASPEPQPEPEPEAGVDLFSQAMQGVAPLSGAVSGRAVAPEPPSPQIQSKADSEAEARGMLLDLVSGKVEFELEYTDEYLQGFVRGMDSSVFRQLKAGRLSPEAHLDLHGLNSEQARSAVLDFVRENYLRDKSQLLLIPGRGVNSPGGQPIIKEELKSWLTRDPLRRVVLAFCTAQPKHGGAGAVYVLLRKSRKVKGKVRWESILDDWL